MKLSYRIILMVILPVVVASAIVINFVNDSFYHETENHFQQRLERTTKDYASLIDLKLRSFSDQVEYASRNIEIMHISEEDIFKKIVSLVEFDTMIYGSAVFLERSNLSDNNEVFYYVHRDGNKLQRMVMREHDDEYKKYFSENKDWLTHPMNTGNGIWTSPYYDEGAGNETMITYSYPLMYNAKKTGVITIDIKLNNVMQIIPNSEKPIEGDFNFQVFVINARDSLVVYAEREDMIGKVAYAFTNASPVNGMVIMDTIISGKTGSGEIRNYTGALSLYAFFAPVKSANWVVVDIIPKSEIITYVDNVVNKTIVTLILSMLAIILIIYISSILITKPITKLSEVTVGIAKGNYDQEVKYQRNDEIGTLAKNFKKMAQDIKNREEQLKDNNIKLNKANKELLVLDNAKNDFLMLLSHEIRTPLNGIIGSTHFLEEMINDPELKNFVDMLKESVERLDKFSKTALEITQLKTIGNKTKKENVAISELIKSAIDENIDFANERNVNIIFSDSKELHLHVNPESAIMAISKILNNAIKFSFVNTNIYINTNIDNESINIEFVNNGVAIDKERLEKITDIFSLGQAHYDKNTGLGLAYVKAFLDLHKGCLKVDYKEELTNFTLCFFREEE